MNPFEILGSTDDIHDPSIPGYATRQQEGDEYRAEPTHASLQLTIETGRMRWFVAMLIIGISALGFRAWSLQILQGTTYAEAAEGNYVRIQHVHADRGLITDRNGTPLVQNVPVFSLDIIPGNLPDDPETQTKMVATMAHILGVTPEVIATLIDESKYPYQPMSVATFDNHEMALRLKLDVERYSGVTVSTVSSRTYIAGDDYSHILGYVGKIPEDSWDAYREKDYLFSDTVGLTGIENEYEDALRGIDGREHVEVDALGRVRAVLAEEPKEPGRTVELTIDSGLEQTAYDALAEMVQSTSSAGGAAVAIDPRSGAIRALVSYPGYDPNLFIDGRTTEAFAGLFTDEMRPLFDRAIAGEYPSGSTIKPIIASAALQEGNITPSTTVLSTGGIRIGQWFFPDWRAGGHGVTDVIKSLADSVNTFYYVIGGGYEDTTGLGVDRIRSYAERFGLNQTLGIDLPGERSGFLPTKEWKEETKGERWYIGDTYHLAIGQGDLLVTPLQMASVASTVANGGTLYRPHLLQSIIDPDTRDVLSGEPIETLIDHVVDRANINVVRDGLRAAVTGGSAVRLNSLPVPAAGKTGTAQFDSSDKTHAWFIGFAPFDNPEIAVAVLVEQGGEGHAAALPVAQQMFLEYFAGGGS